MLVRAWTGERRLRLAAAEALLEECIYQPERLPDAMEAAGRLLGYDFFCLVSANLRQPAFIASDEQKDGIVKYFSGGWPDDDYRARTVQRHPQGRLYLDHRAVSLEERTQSAIYNELYRPLNMSHYAGIRFDAGGEEWFCSASRSEDKGVIDGFDASAFKQVAKTAIRVASLEARLQQSRANGMLEGLSSSGTPAVIINHAGEVSAVTSAAERIFGKDFGVRGGVLWSLNADDASALAGLAMSARLGERELMQKSILVRGQGRRHPVLVTASQVLGAGLDELPGARLLLILSDLGAQDSVASVELCNLFDLTTAEGDVATMIADGLEVVEIASRRNVAASTVRAQVKSIFRKMGINRQVELARIVVRLKT